MGIVKEQKREIEKLNGKINTLKRMCQAREKEKVKFQAIAAAAEQMCKILLMQAGGTVEIEYRDWKRWKDVVVMACDDEKSGKKIFKVIENN